ncbi:hypothetical protein [Estrella lausannensis]|uniref:Uncharacterized protein n=1 Tax=Estrella lausannensis TaxID=483423 RepID=A0A0H5DRE2_9BACT|nr:hypothetical protein [Estrella lausannensis]CRX39261.1 Hypothetical protein ELAC_1937 [Estrella lausannensis]
MHSLGSYFSYSAGDRLSNNIQEIINFPADDNNAQIKASSQGVLGRADGKKGNWAVNWVSTKAGYATELPGTVQAIDETFNAVIDEYKQNFENLRREGPTTKTITALKDCFQKELSMIEGLKNICNVYHQRYDLPKESAESKTLASSVYSSLFQVDASKKQEGLHLLDDTAHKWGSVIAQHGEEFSQLVQYYKEQQEAQSGSFDLSASVISPKAFQQFSKQEATGRLDAFLATWSHHIDPTEAREMIDQGQELMGYILKGVVTNPAETPMGSEKAVTSLMWYLMKLAIDKKQGHDQGSFGIEDPQGRLYQFLLKAEGCGDRESSHYVGRSEATTGISTLVMKSSRHKGIDVVSGKLPADKRHLLFAQVDANTPPLHGDASSSAKEKILFIKLEDFSPFMTTAYGYDFAMHGAELAIAQYNKAFLPGSDDLPEMAKERVPAATVREFIAQVRNLDHVNLSEINQKMTARGFAGEPEKAAKLYGIAYMTAFMQEAGNLAILPIEFDPSKFFASLPNLDHMDRRTGREVYLTADELI